MTTISGRQLARFLIYTKIKNNCEMVIYIQKSRHFSKSKTIFVTFFYIQKSTHFALHNFHGFLKFEEVGGIFINKKHFTFCYVLYPKNTSLSVTSLYTKSLTLCVTFLYPKNNALCVTFIYIKFIV